MAIHFLNATEDEFLSTKMLYRFCPLERALQSLEGGYLWFANPLEWNDPFEKRYMNAEYRIKGRKRSLELPIKNKVVCLCLTKTYSCEAFWTVYAKNDIGIEFSINKETLLDVLKGLSDCEVYIGECNYMHTKDIMGYAAKNPELVKSIFSQGNPRAEQEQIGLMLLKRVAFQYEDEFRIILVKNKHSDSKGEKIYFDKNKLVSKITLDPRIGTETERALKSFFKEKYGIPVVKSSIYAERKPPVIKL